MYEVAVMLVLWRLNGSRIIRWICVGTGAPPALASSCPRMRKLVSENVQFVPGGKSRGWETPNCVSSCGVQALNGSAWNSLVH